MRFYTTILAISAAALSIATTTPGLTITSLQFYEPLEPVADDNVSINIDIEAGDVTDTCIAEWKYGTDGKTGYPTSFTACVNGYLSFYFSSYTSISEWTVVAKYTYSVGVKVKYIIGQVSVTKDDLFCGEYLNSNRCELADKYTVNGLHLTKAPK